MNDQSRRNWLIVISQAAVGCGFTKELSSLAFETSSLPPGTYAPSKDHLGHALASTEQFHPVIPGCPTDYVLPKEHLFEPSFFDGSQFAIVQTLVALLLGETVSVDRPELNPIAQEVAEWIDRKLRNTVDACAAAHGMNPLHRRVSLAYLGSAEVEETETADPGRVCGEGFVWIGTRSRQRFSRDFVHLRHEEQRALLDEISDDRTDKQVENAGTRLFDLLKGETIRGFYTSRVGLKELDFKGNAYYGRSPGCQS